MPTHSGTQYHLRNPISEMDPKIASIAKLLTYLLDLTMSSKNWEAIKNV